ncbi:MAG: hypothetical protein H6709_12695 [Kofleriaceae bacterium]|nr:hypothetical protein [Kofleriaceae bacterium]
MRARAEAALGDALDGDAGTQGTVVAALALVGSPRVAPLLYRALSQGPDLRVRAARALRELACPRPRPGCAPCSTAPATRSRSSWRRAWWCSATPTARRS